MKMHSVHIINTQAQCNVQNKTKTVFTLLQFSSHTVRGSPRLATYHRLRQVLTSAVSRRTVQGRRQSPSITLQSLSNTLQSLSALSQSQLAITRLLSQSQSAVSRHQSSVSVSRHSLSTRRGVGEGSA